MNSDSERIGYFEGEPDAQAAAQVLRDLGYTADVQRCTDESYAETVKKFFEGESAGFEKNAVVTSDADGESFQRIITEHGGRVAYGI